mmetsp:Transcript_2927/g.6706  ORF Transcript_2927/g.6706 Transcript_2927/m.6706 type:complete len:893 (-) Transcript_2927:334-3012(-)
MGDKTQQPPMDFREIQDAVRELPEDIDFPAVMELLTSKHTASVVDRHIKAVMKICRQCANGFLLKHLPYLVELVEIAAARWKKGQREWADPICAIAQIGGQPFSSCASEDLLQFGKHLPSFVNAVISILQDAQPGDKDAQKDMIRIEISYMIASIARYGLDDDWVQEGADDSVIQNVASTGTPSLRLLQQTNVVAEIARVFRMEHSPEALVIMLGALKDMSLFMPLAVQITNCGLLSNLIAVIRNNLLGSDVLLVSAEILWNVLELDREHASAALGAMDVMESFVVFLTTVLHEGYRYKDKIFRNDMVALLIFILSRDENRDTAARSGLVCLLLKHAAEGPIRDMLETSRVFEEELEGITDVPVTIFLPRKMGSAGPNQTRKAPIALTTGLEDMEFRILLWRAIAKTANTERCAELIEKFLFPNLLLRFLDVVSQSHNEAQWSPDQRKKLQLEAMRVLFSVVPHCPSSYLESDGNGVVIRLLQTTTDQDLQKACLTLLHRSCLSSTRADGFEQIDIAPCCMLDDSHLDVVEVLLEIFQNRVNPFSLRQLACSILGCLCRQDEKYSTRFRKAKGVETVAKEVRWNPQGELQDRLFFMLHVVDCVWCAIVGDTANEERFLKQGGLFSLLDALEMAPVMLRRHILGCVADLVQNPNAANLFVQWNSGKTMKGGLKILLEFWSEEQDIAEAVNGEGLIQNLDFPLNPKLDPLTVAAANKDATNSGAAGSAKDAATLGGSDGSNPPLVMSPVAEKVAKAENLSIHKLQNPASSTSVLELAARVDQDSRPKIYATLSKIGFEKNETLTMQERQALELLRLLPECLALEQLRQVEWNLQDFKLLAQDQKWLDDMIQEQRTRTEWIQNVQSQLFEEHQTQQVANLQKYYDDIRNRFQVTR